MKCANNRISINNGKIPIDWNTNINIVKKSLEKFNYLEREFDDFTELFIRELDVCFEDIDKIQIKSHHIMHFYDKKLKKWSLTIHPENKEISLKLYDKYKEKSKCVPETTNSHKTKIFNGENDIEKINIECDSYMLGIDFYLK